jgi:hypothetical protein
MVLETFGEIGLVFETGLIAHFLDGKLLCLQQFGCLVQLVDTDVFNRGIAGKGLDLPVKVVPADIQFPGKGNHVVVLIEKVLLQFGVQGFHKEVVLALGFHGQAVHEGIG